MVRGIERKETKLFRLVSFLLERATYTQTLQ